MTQSILNKNNWILSLFALSAVILAYEPVQWLITTWRDPSYASSGFFLFLPTLALFIWSVSSKKLSADQNDIRLPLILLLCSMITRTVGQAFAINMISALTLIVDVYAIARLFGLEQRARAISPFWISAAFAFTLPLERVAQRIMGYGLQNISADGACFVLGNLFENVTCQGIRILINHQDVMVDLPCSGARAALLLLFFFCLIAAVARFSLKDAFLGLLITITSAYVTNILRICILSAGIGYPSLVGGIDVMSQPAHDMIGLLILSLGGTPVILWARRCYKNNQLPSLPKKVVSDGWWLIAGNKNKFILPTAIISLVVAVGITQISSAPVDVARKDIPVNLPAIINGNVAQSIPLTEQEKSYFTAYGGSAKKASYGNKNLMIIKTSSPLRHLHAPDTCLRGLGMDVEYVGADYNHLPTAIYKATDDKGLTYRVLVTFASADFSHITTNVSEAVWRWTQDPSVSWMAIQRISHWDDPTYGYFEQGVLASVPHEKENIQLAGFNGEVR